MSNRTSYRLAPRLLLPVLLLAASPALRAEDELPAYERAPAVTAADLFAPDVRQGPHHRLRDEVTTEGYVHRFGLETDYGFYAPTSERLLRIRLREVATMARLLGMEAHEEVLEGIKNRLVQIPTGAVEIIKDPLGAAEALAEGAETTLRRLGDLFRRRGRTRYEPDRDVDSVLFAGARRRVAWELDVDPYSSNSKLQEMLSEVARARGAGRFTADLATLALPTGIGTVAGVSQFREQVRTMLRDRTPEELDRANDAALAARHVPFDTRRRFLAHPWLSPRHKTVIAQAAVALKGTRQIGSLIAASLDTTSEVEALFHEAQALTLLHHARTTESFERLDHVGGIVVGFTTSGDVIVPLPYDVLYWSEDVEQGARAMLQLPGVAEAPRRTLLVSGRVTPRAAQALQGLGWTAVPDVSYVVAEEEASPEAASRDG